MPKKENLQLYFKELIKESPTRKDICDLFVYEPRNAEETQLGTLFMLGKIENIPKNRYRNFDFLLSLLISVIKREFYSDFNRSATEALEASLNKANLYLADFTEKGNTEWIGNLDFICGVFFENTLHITQVGKPIIKLFRKTTISHIDKKFPAQKKHSPAKTFGNIASGTVSNGDKIIMSINNVLTLEAKARKITKETSINISSAVAMPQNKHLLKEQPSRVLLISRKISTLIFLAIYKIIHKTIKPLAPIYHRNKPAFFTASVLIILILILPFATAQKINYHIKMNRFNRLSAEIQEAQRKTDLALIYQDQNKARALVQKNQALIAELLYFKELPEALALQKKHQNQQDSINNVKRIEQLEEILDFSTSGFIVNPVEINKIKNTLYFYELDSGILYKFNMSDEKKLTLIFISAKDELRKMVSLENEQIVLFGQSGKMYLYNSNTNDYKSYDLAISVENIRDVKSFLSNFYILDIKNGIIKYSNELKENSWLSEQLENAQSMAIDGSIYVLDSNGIIYKYFQGRKAEEIQPKLDKPLEGNNKIFIKSDFKNLFISDPQNKRLIVLSKDGEIINQYVNDKFSNLQDFWVTENEKEVYLLCDKKVFKINL